MKEIIIYTDGGCSGNPGPGGWGAVILTEQKEIQISGGEKLTTNNRMELTAAISALQKIFAIEPNESTTNFKIKMYCDSKYVQDGITSWIIKWKQNNWKTSTKKNVLNKDLWEQLDKLNSGLNIEWVWVKGHAGIKYNEICDSLCKQEMSKFF